MSIFKKTIRFSCTLLLLGAFFAPSALKAQGGDDETAIVKLQYFNINNGIQYLMLESTVKKNKVFTPKRNIVYRVFLDSACASNLISEVKTDESGKAKMVIPASLKTAWGNASLHTFIVKLGDEEVLSDYAITKGRIVMDTSTIEGVRNISVRVFKEEKGGLIPVPDVEMRVGIKRHGGILSGGDADTYTTDSSGSVLVAFTRNNIPGDFSGQIMITAKIEDNEMLGNVSVEKNVAWGTPAKQSEDFFSRRELWSTRFRSPYWLLFMAYAIVIGVYGTLAYLVYQLVRVIKIGRQV